MAKTATSTLEVQFAKRKTLDKGSENVAAALDQLETASQSVSKSHAIVKRRIEELDEMLGEMEARMRDMEATYDRETAAMKEMYTRDTTELKTKLHAAEEKLRKISTTLT